MSPKSSSAPEFGVNLFGYLTSNLGLGVAGRNTARMLLDNNVPLRLTDVDPGGGMRGRDSSLAEEIRRTADSGPYSVNLFHINPDQVLYLLNPRTRLVPLDRQLNACVPFWELPRLPRPWFAPLGAMDLILAPTLFVEAAVKADLPQSRVVHYPQTVHVPKGIRPDRATFGLPTDATVFVTSFDMRSDIERKNPWGAIEAFRAAFPGRDDVRLVIKANNVETLPGLARHVKRLREVAADARVIIHDQSMAYRDILTLYASCDALISLHRSEGLGLSLLEAMALGKPVVATAWSGNMDFTTPENSCLVGYDMVDVKASTQPAYGKAYAGAQQWAEPRLAEAVTWMQRLADEPGLAAAIGARAALDVQKITAEYDRGPVIATLRELDAERAAAERGGVGAARGAAMRALRAKYPWYYGRRLVRAAWHRLKTRARG